MDESSIWQCDWSLQRVREVVHEQLDTGRQLPEAILCANDDTAIIVMHALLKRDLRVPEDVAVVGFDDIPIARYMHPPLATVNQPVEQLGSTAFEMLVSMFQGGEQTGKILLPTTFVPRQSCGCA
jgi:LacI family transcriptional regulator